MRWIILAILILSSCGPKPVSLPEDPVKNLARAILKYDVLETEYACLYTCRPRWCAAMAEGLLEQVDQDLSNWVPGGNFKNTESFYIWIGVRHFTNHQNLKEARRSLFCRRGY